MITKSNLLWFSGIITTTILIINYLGTFQVCSLDRGCAQLLADTIRMVFIIVPLFILSLITYKMREEVFQPWLKFAYVWVPLTIILTFLAPEYDASLVSITKGAVSFVMSGAFLLISIIIIITKSFFFKKQP